MTAWHVPSASRWRMIFSPPNTRLGWWSVGLALVPTLAALVLLLGELFHKW